jgi:archaellum component FlaG (FlaF/FlaG flagellin family)
MVAILEIMKTKNLFITILFTCLILGCKTKSEKKTAQLIQNTSEILFQVKTNDKDDLEIFENGIIPWISIKNPESEIKNLIGKDEIVIDNDNATLIIDYPLNKPIEIKIKSANSNGFTRKELVQKISIEYNRIYKEEEESAETKTIPIEERKGLINRNQTDGKYGIWGHDIDDLDLSAVILRKTDKGELKLELIVES